MYIYLRFYFLLIVLAILNSCASQNKTVQNTLTLQDFPAYVPTGKELKVAVFDFKNESFFESPTLGPGTATMFQTALVRSKRFIVIDRENLSKILEEQKLGLAGITNQDLSSIGNQLGVDYLITGKVTEFGIKRTGTSVGAGAIDVKSFTGGGVKVKKEKGTARIVIDVKITSVKNGQIIYMGSATGEAYSDNVNAGLALLTGSGIAAGTTINSGVQGFDQTIAGKAARVAAYKMVNQLINDNVFNWK